MEYEKHQYPRYRFPGQRENENIQLIIRKHWVVDAKIALGFLFFGIIPFIVAILLEIFVWTGFTDTVLTILLFFDLYLLTVLAVTYTEWLNDELDVVIITDNRIISHEQLDMFHRQVSEAHLSQIQDVTGIQKGVFQSLLDYGTVEVQTSSADVFFIIKFARKPAEIARRILDLRDHASKAI